VASAPLAPRVNIYEAVAANRVRTLVLLGVFTGIVAAIAYAVGEVMAPGTGIAALPVGLGVSAVAATASYFAGDKVVLGMSKARELKEGEEPHLQNVVEALAIGSGLQKPKLYLIDDGAPNAFATGRDPKHASIAVTRGLLDKLDRAELEGVMAHELSHIANRDIRTMLLAAVLAGTVVLFADVLLRWLRFGGARRGRRDRDGGAAPFILIVALVLAVVGPIVARLITLAVSREREYLADASAAMLTRYPPGLASALRKIAADPEPLEVANKATEPLYIANPLRDRPTFLDGLFETHPPIAERINRLEAM
jgi:heat shock protein HtpX